MNRSAPSASASGLLESGREVIKIEAAAVSALESRLNETFAAACGLLLACRGRVVVTGMGKSGHIGRKLAATMASTGTPAFYVHPAEASHGDLGMITPEDVVIALSNSGQTPEVVTIVPLIKRLGVPLIALTGEPDSMLARAAEFIPSLASMQMVRTWIGFRPATPDKLPLIGAWQAITGTWIAAGHEGLGITTSPGTAQLLAALVAGRQPAIDASAFEPARYTSPDPPRAASGSRPTSAQ